MLNNPPKKTRQRSKSLTDMNQDKMYKPMKKSNTWGNLGLWNKFCICDLPMRRGSSVDDLVLQMTNKTMRKQSLPKLESSYDFNILHLKITKIRRSSSMDLLKKMHKNDLHRLRR